MPVIEAPAGAWTAIPDSGADQIIEAREKGLYVDTSGALLIANAAQGYALAAGMAMVVSAAIFTANTVQVTPANTIKAASVRHSNV